MKKFSLKKSSKRGFGLIDVSLGIIAGIGLLVGAVLVFQQVTTNSTVSEVTRNSTTISSEIRAAARNLPSFNNLVNPTTPAAGPINLANFGLEDGIINNPAVTATAADATFDLVFTGLRDRPCQRAAVSPANLGVNVTNAVCSAGALTVTFTR